MALRPLYSTQFTSWAVSTLPPLFTVPEGFVAVVRDVDVSTGGGEIINWVWGIDSTVKLGGGQFTIEALGQFQQWRGRQVVPAGHFIYVQSDGPTDGAVSGYLLSV